MTTNPTDFTAAAAGARRVESLPFPVSRRTDAVSVRPGARVIVRRTTSQIAGSGRPAVTDVIGKLTSIDPLIIAPQARSTANNETGEPVTIPHEQVVVLKTLSAKPVRNSDIRAVEEAIATAFPGIANTWVGGWLCRAGDGITERSNSAVPIGPSAGMQPVPTQAIREFYAEHQLPTQLLIPDRIGRSAENLTGTRGPEILVMTRDISDLADIPQIPLSGDAGDLHPDFAGRHYSINVRDYATPEWLSRYHFRGRPLPAKALELLATRIEGTLGFAEITIDDQVVAITRATITSAAGDSQNFLGFSAVEVEPDFRRHQLGATLGQAVLHWGARHGAEDAYLEVIESNTAGRGLYEKLGFSEHHRHHSLELDP